MISRRHWTLYVLRLEQNKWYVGITSHTTQHRFQQHVRGYGSNWTRKYKPIEVFDTKDLGNCDIAQAELFEGRATRKYMEKYGDNNVRGGDLTSTEEYIRRFGYLYPKDTWNIITGIILLLVVILLLVMDKYHWNIGAFLGFVGMIVLVQIIVSLYDKRASKKR